MRRLVVAVALSAALVGCSTEVQDEVAICNTFCECRYGLPSLRDACIEQCVEGAPNDVPAACAACVLNASCVEVAGGQCNDACDPDDDVSRTSSTEEMP
jgi:hypothetical protein